MPYHNELTGEDLHEPKIPITPQGQERPAAGFAGKLNYLVGEGLAIAAQIPGGLGWLPIGGGSGGRGGDKATLILEASNADEIIDMPWQWPKQILFHYLGRGHRLIYFPPALWGEEQILNFSLSAAALNRIQLGWNQRHEQSDPMWAGGDAPEGHFLRRISPIEICAISQKSIFQSIQQIAADPFGNFPLGTLKEWLGGTGYALPQNFNFLFKPSASKYLIGCWEINFMSHDNSLLREVAGGWEIL